MKKLLDFSKKCRKTNTKRKKGMIVLGIVLHAVQDSYAHASGPNTLRYDYDIGYGISDNRQKWFRKKYKEKFKERVAADNRWTNSYYTAWQTHVAILDNEYVDRKNGK